MNAIQIREHGGPEVLTLHELPDPEPGPGEVRVRVRAAGVNFIDTYQREGRYSVELPWVPGLEGAGEVDAVGPGVSSLRPGDRVAWSSTPGSYAELTTVPVERLVKIPEGLAEREAAALMLQGMTAHYLAHDTYPLQPGHTCLVHAVAGGVGLLLTQIAVMRGARVIGTASTAEKAERAKAVGADAVIDYTAVDFREALLELTGGDGVEVVYDSVGADTFERSLDCLKPRGMLVLYGASSGPVPPFDPQILNRKGSLFLTRPSLFHYIPDRDSLERRAGDVLTWAATEQLQLRIDTVWPLARAADAHRHLEGRKSSGKILLEP